MLALVEHLATFVLHVSGLHDGDVRKLHHEAYLRRCKGVYAIEPWDDWLDCYTPTAWEPSESVLLTDHVENKSDVRVEYVINAINQLYRERGWVVFFPDSLVPSMRMLAIPPPHHVDCNMSHDANPYHLGVGFTNADIELFVKLHHIADFNVHRVFEIGNAFGYSTLVIAHIFGVPVDALDAEVTRCAHLGTRLTHELANSAGLEVHVTHGFSPQDVPAAVRRAPYDLAFIDGKHTVEQLILDVEAVRPWLAESSIIVLHDVDAFNLHDAVHALRFFRLTSTSFHYLRFPGVAYRNLLGTGLLIQGLRTEIFTNLGTKMDW